jgi:hypothetical protein
MEGPQMGPVWLLRESSVWQVIAAPAARTFETTCSSVWPQRSLRSEAKNRYPLTVNCNYLSLSHERLGSIRYNVHFLFKPIEAITSTRRHSNPIFIKLKQLMIQSLDLFMNQKTVYIIDFDEL